MFISSAVIQQPMTQLMDQQVPTKEFTNAMDNELEEDTYDKIATQCYQVGDEQKCSDQLQLSQFNLNQVNFNIQHPRTKRSRFDFMFETHPSRKTKRPLDQIVEISEIENTEDDALANRSHREQQSNNLDNINNKAYKCYELGQALIVGGGIGQLNDEEDINNRFQNGDLQDEQRASLWQSNDFENVEGDSQCNSLQRLLGQRVEFVQWKKRDNIQPQGMDVDDVCHQSVPGIGCGGKESMDGPIEDNVIFQNHEKKDRKQRNYRKLDK
eukprot:TRINITY_DN5775_c0_g2_i4.p1 TRINITY_DN5775_c0_g2~~TRINITY_DN5775_c0_g2_i4.p1  ORF type:complete len:291 (-),score=40.41 TRINITY_DN5775_c0_g2_i4:278-1084(-)